MGDLFELFGTLAKEGASTAGAYYTAQSQAQLQAQTLAQQRADQAAALANARQDTLLYSDQNRRTLIIVLVGAVALVGAIVLAKKAR